MCDVTSVINYTLAMLTIIINYTLAMLTIIINYTLAMLTIIMQSNVITQFTQEWNTSLMCS